MKNIFFALVMLIMIVGIGFGQQRETVKEVQVEIQTAKWLQVSVDDEFPIYLNTSKITRINGLVFFRTKFVKRGTTVYRSYAANCSSDLLAGALVGWAQYGNNPKLVDIGIEREDGEDENGMFTATRGTVAWSLLDYACAHPTKTEVIQN